MDIRILEQVGAVALLAAMIPLFIAATINAFASPRGRR